MTGFNTQFEKLETEYNVFDLSVDGLPLWEQVRFGVARKIAQAQGQGQAHSTVSGVTAYVRGLSLWLRNFIQKNPYLADEHEFLFVGHPRRKLEADGHWWDIYCDPIYQQADIDYIHTESPYLLSHRVPPQTNNIRYLDLIQFTGTLQRKLGLRSPSLPEKTQQRITAIEAEIAQRFSVTVDVESMIRNRLHVRRTTLPLYTRLLDRIAPDVVVVVVSYGKEIFIEACKQQDIPVVELQHGVIYDQHFGYSYPEEATKVMSPDYLFTFGEFWNQNARFPIAEDRVIPVGYPYLDQQLNKYNNVPRSEQLIFISQGTVGRELSQLAVAVADDDRITHQVIYKLHPGEYDRWQEAYPWLIDSRVRVIAEPEPPLYQLLASSTAQVGVGSTAVYEGLCFELETYVYDTDGAEVLLPLVEQGVASLIETKDELVSSLKGERTTEFDRAPYFKPNAIENAVAALERVQQENC